MIALLNIDALNAGYFFYCCAHRHYHIQTSFNVRNIVYYFKLNHFNHLFCSKKIFVLVQVRINALDFMFHSTCTSANFFNKDVKFIQKQLVVYVYNCLFHFNDQMNKGLSMISKLRLQQKIFRRQQNRG